MFTFDDVFTFDDGVMFGFEQTMQALQTVCSSDYRKHDYTISAQLYGMTANSSNGSIRDFWRGAAHGVGLANVVVRRRHDLFTQF